MSPESPKSPRFSAPEVGKKKDMRNKGLRFVPTTKETAISKADKSKQARPSKIPGEALAPLLGKAEVTKEKPAVKQPEVPKVEAQVDKDTLTPLSLEQRNPGESTNNSEVEKRTHEQKIQHRDRQEQAPVEPSENTQPEQVQEKPKQNNESDTSIEETQEAYDFPTRELNLQQGELGLGEGVIQLNGSEPVIEHVIPLHGPEISREPPEVIARRAAFEAEHAAATLQAQPEQQHMARDNSEQVPFVHPEAATPAPEAGGGGGEVPPTVPPEQGGAAPEQPEPEEPNRVNQTDMEILPPYQSETLGGMSTPNAAPAVSPSERPATKQELDQAFARSASLHGQRGVLSGLLFGAWFTNRGLRRRQKQETKELQRQARQIEQLQQQLSSSSNVQERQHINVNQRLNATEKQFENRPAAPKVERAKSHEPVQEPEIAKQQPDIQPGRLRQTSAWHTIEVDKKTGKPVEAPSFEYGHEYFRERAHENGPKDQRNARAGEIAIVAATNAAVVSKSSDNKKSGSKSQSVRSTAQNTFKKVRDTATSAAQTTIKSLKGNDQAGPIWPWAVALLALVVVITLLI